MRRTVPPFYVLVAFPVFAFIITFLAAFPASATSNCSGHTGWVTPGTPTTFGQFGSYVKTMSNYNTATDCDGYATKNYITGTWQTYATSQAGDGHDTSYDYGPDGLGRPQTTEANAESVLLTSGAASQITKTNTYGGWSNLTRTQDTFECNVPGAGTTELTNIGFELCYHYETTATGTTVNHTAGDGEVSIYAANITGGGDDVTWVPANGYEIKHISGGTPVYDKCTQGYFTVKGASGQFKTSMATDALGTSFQQGTGAAWQRDGFVNGSFTITGVLPPGVTPPSRAWTCDTGSGVEYPPPLQEPDDCGSLDILSCECSSKKTPDPIDFVSGFKTLTEVDYTGASPLMLKRIYRSDGAWLNYRFGKFWRHNYDRTLNLTATSNVTVAIITTAQGQQLSFRKMSNGTWQSYNLGETATFAERFSGSTLIGYLYTTPGQTSKEYYDTSGKLTRIEYLASEAVNFTYDGSGRLSTVTDESGRTLTFSYDGSGRVSSVATPDGTYSYTYGSNNNLTQVTKPDTETRQYHYEDGSFVNALTGLTNENGVRYLTWDYDAQGRPISSERAGGTNSYSISYDSDTQVTVTNPLGKDTIYTIKKIAESREIVKVDGVASANCPASQALMGYDAKGRLIKSTDWEGNITRATYDSRGLPLTVREGFGQPEGRTTTTTWHASFPLPDQTVLDDLTMDYDYDAYGRLTTVTATDTNTSNSRIWALDYYSNGTDGSGNTILGRLKEVDGPRTDVTDKTMFTYDGNYNLTKIKNALNQETEITARDSAGRPTTVEDPNGVETDLTYDTNGRLETITVAPGTALEAVTTLDYSDAGDITDMELPNGTTMGFTYDNARRLTKITDSLGNTSNFTLNNAGNVTKEERKDSGNTLKFQYTQTFDEMARILKHIGAGAQEWDFAYDKNSNLTAFTDANNNQTTYAFDALQRLVSSTDAISGVTNATVNQLDQTTKIEDPRTNDTDYVYNAFGDVTQLTSPDTGTATFVYDPAGNVTQMTDARSVVTNYTYDALNRLLTVAYPSDSSLNVTLTYDDNPSTPGNCGTSIGELCRVVDPSGTTDYKYNALGQLIEVKEVRGALTFTTAYEYDLAGLLKKITYPSGRQATYTRNTNGQVTGVSAPVNGSSVAIASSIAYLPFGPVTGLTYGNGKSLSSTFDQDYRLTSRSVGGVFSESYTYDANGNILTKGSHTYDYDAMNRITEEIFGMTTTAWAYDSIGNRTSETVNSTPTAYTYPAGSSKLSSVGGTSYTYDAMGNVTQKGPQAFVYNAAAQMKEAKLSGVTVGTYTYNAFNQRTKKVAGGNTVHYVYGPGGGLIGEYNGSGALIREYIHANGEPLAQIDKPGASESILYLHTDHLLTARYATNAAGSTVWTWDSGAFGKEAPTGTATINLRFPGQYFDAETGLHYNWHRYYDPATGRYITSDPIGLDGGLDTFGYAAQNPLIYIDPDGLLFGVDDVVIGAVIAAVIKYGLGAYFATLAVAPWVPVAMRGGEGWQEAACKSAWNATLGAFFRYGIGWAVNSRYFAVYAAWFSKTRFGKGFGKVYGTGIIYRVPGGKTRSGKEYVGRSSDWEKTRSKYKGDGRDRKYGKVETRYPRYDVRAGRVAEQERMNAPELPPERRGVKNLDNGKNEIDRKKWRDFGVDDPEEFAD